MPETDLALLLQAAEASGRIALGHLGRRPDTWEKPGGQGPVTEADLEIDRMLRAELTAARPDYGWLSEESRDDPGRLGAHRVFIVDPIDGTRAFVAGEPGYAHALAVAEAGRVIAGVVHLPALERTYAATEGAGATLNGAPIAASRSDALATARVLASAQALAPEHWPGGVPNAERHFRTSIAYRLCLVAEGRFDAMVTLRDTWEWDVAAGDLIAREAGAVVTTREDRVALYNRAPPVVPGMIAAGAALHAEIIGRL